MAKKYPHHPDAEQAVLGSIFLDNKIAPEVFDTLSESDFFLEPHIYIYQAMKDLFNKNSNIDYTSVSAILESKNLSEKTGGIGYLLELSNYVVSTENIDTYMNLVSQASLKRDIINVTSQIAQEGLTKDLEAVDYLDSAEKKLFALSKRRKVGELTPLSKIIHDVKEKTEANYRRKSDITGLTTGFTQLDKKTNGLQNEELIILAARPSVGKSAFAMNLALNVAKRNDNAGVAIFSLEMSNEQLVTRMISSEANIENSKLRTGYLSPAEWRQLESFSESLERLNIYFDDSSAVDMSEMRAKCRKLSQEGKLSLIVIDYLQLINMDTKGSKSDTRQVKVSETSRALKQMARELKVPVIALSQLSRDVEKREDKRPILADLRESGSIEQDADVVMFLYRDEYYKKGESDAIGEAELIIAKNRQGSLGDVKFLFAASYSRFTEKSTTFDEEVN